MNTSELYRVTQWIEQQVVGRSIVELYETLHRILQQHVESGRPGQSFAVQRDRLLEALASVSLDVLSRAQLEFLHRLGIAQAIGEQGVDRVEDTLYRNVIDVATSAHTIGLMLETLQEGIGRSQQIAGGLQGLVDDNTRVNPEEVFIRVLFTGPSRIDNLVDMKYWSERWHDIGHGIAFARGETAEQVRIVGAGSGEVSLELAASVHFATTASDIILAALQLNEKVQDINRKAEELRGMQLNNNKLIMDLEKEAESETRSGVDNISADMVAKLGLRKNGEGDKITALMKSVRHLMDFIDQGGDVDFVLPAHRPEDAADDLFAGLRDNFEHIRRLRKRLMDDDQMADVIQAA